MTDQDIDIAALPPGPERERLLRRARRRYFICTWADRLFMTLVMAAFVVLGAESWTAAWIMVGLGMAMDLVRNRIAPDLTFDISRIAAELEAAQTPEPPAPPSTPKSQIYAIHCVLAGYMFVLIIAEYIAGSAGLREYLNLFSPLHELASSAMSMIRRHVAQIQGIGLMDRAVFVTHLYTVVGVYIVLSAFLISLITYKFMIYAHKKSGIKGIRTQISIKKTYKKPNYIIYAVVFC